MKLTDAQQRFLAALGRGGIPIDRRRWTQRTVRRLLTFGLIEIRDEHPRYFITPAGRSALANTEGKDKEPKP